MCGQKYVMIHFVSKIGNNTYVLCWGGGRGGTEWNRLTRILSNALIFLTSGHILIL